MKKFFICFLIFFITGIGSAFLGLPGDATFIVGGICAFLYLIFSGKKKQRSKNEKEFRKAEQDFNDSMSMRADIQSTKSYCILDKYQFYGWKNADYVYCPIVLKNNHDYNLFKARNSERYWIYVYDIEGSRMRKEYFSSSSDAVEALEKMDCKFCKWFKKKKGRDSTYEEFNNWKVSKKE